MTATTKHEAQASIAIAPAPEAPAVPDPIPAAPADDLAAAVAAVLRNQETILDTLREIRAGQDALALDLASLREDVKAGAGLTQCSCVDQDTLAGIYRAIQAREAAHAPEASQDAPEESDAAGERERAIPAHVAADLSSCHTTGYADAGIAAFTSHAAFMQRAAREGAPESQVGFLVRLIARLNLAQQPATIRAALGSAVASGRAPSPNMTAVLHRARPAGSTPATHLGTLAWLAATPPGEQFSRYSLIMQRARTAESLYAEWDANVGVGR